eukprot:2260230-Prymnesium_polylepis.1
MRTTDTPGVSCTVSFGAELSTVEKVGRKPSRGLHRSSQLDPPGRICPISRRPLVEFTKFINL